MTTTTYRLTLSDDAGEVVRDLGRFSLEALFDYVEAVFGEWTAESLWAGENGPFFCGEFEGLTLRYSA